MNKRCSSTMKTHLICYPMTGSTKNYSQFLSSVGFQRDLIDLAWVESQDKKKAREILETLFNLKMLSKRVYESAIETIEASTESSQTVITFGGIGSLVERKFGPVI